MTRRAWVAALAAAAFAPAVIAGWKRYRQRRELDDVFAYGQARFRVKLRSEGLDPDRMTEDEKMDYVDRVIHEYREEQRAKP